MNGITQKPPEKTPFSLSRREMLLILALLILFILALLPWVIPRGTCPPLPPPPVAPDKLVYSRQPRIAEKYENWHRWFDAGAPDRFTEADLVIDDLNGHVKVIYDCTGVAAICAASDNRVSPDGTQILFTVETGQSLYPVQLWDSQEVTPPIEFTATHYQLMVYDVTTGEVYQLEDNARQGDWLSNFDVVFLSNRANTYPPAAVGGVVPGYNVKALQLYRAKIANRKLTQIVNLTPAAPFVLNPMVTSTGRICYSEWDGFGAVRASGHTPANFWWPRCMDGDGSDDLVVANAHGGPCIKTRDYLTGIVDPYRSGEGCTIFKVLRPLREINAGTLASTTYYRSNHKQLGIIVSWQLKPGQEGFSIGTADKVPEIQYPCSTPGCAQYIPPLFVNTPYANDQDTTAVGTRFMLDGRAMGKAGNAAPTMQGRGLYIFTHARGSCYEGTTQQYNSVEAMGGEPTCQQQIREAYALHITNPFDEKQSKVLACPGTEFNCFDANWVVPYARFQFGGKAAPDFKEYVPPTSDKTELHIVDARKAELFKLSGSNYRPEDDCTYQGCASPDYANLVTHIRIDKITNWTRLPDRTGWETLTLQGLFPINNADGSMKIQLPCGIAYRTSGVKANGEIIALDQTAHAAKCGEVVTCHGCHDGHSIERQTELGATAVERFAKTAAARQPPVASVQSEEKPPWQQAAQQ